MRSTLVSVVVPVYNRAWCIRECIASILATRHPRLEIIVVDDGSSDGTERILGGLSRDAGERQIRIARHPGGENRGIAASRNLGLKLSRGRYLAFLDSDDLYHPCRFEFAIPWLERHPDRLAGIEPYELAYLHGEEATRVEYHLTRRACRGGGLGEALLRAMLTESVYWKTPVVTLRREAFDIIGRFDTRLRFAEETALWLKLAAADGVGVVQDHTPVAQVRRHGEHSWDSSKVEVAHDAFLGVLLDTVAWVRAESPRVGMSVRGLVGRRLHRYVLEILAAKDLTLPFKARALLRGVRYRPHLVVERRAYGGLARSCLSRVLQR